MPVYSFSVSVIHKVIEDPETFEMTSSHGQCQETENPGFICSPNSYLLLRKIVQSIIAHVFLIKNSTKHGQLQMNELSGI